MKSLNIKRNNICIFGLPESDNTDPEEAYKERLATIQASIER